MKTLSKIFLAGITMLISLGVSAGNLFNYSDIDKDTVILKFGNNSQIVVYVDSKDDLKDLTNYDINKILEDLNLQVNDLNDSVRVLEIKDETGEKYLKDTTVVYKVEPSTTNTSSYVEDDQGKKKFRYHPRSRFDFILDVGLNNYTENGKFPTGTELYALNPIGSWYWNLGPTFRTHIAGPVFIDLGLTAALNIHRYNNNATRIAADAATGVTFSADTTAVSHSKSKLSTWHIQAKAIPMVAFGSNHRRGWRLWNNVDKGFRIGAGPYVGYRIWSRTKYKFNDGTGDRKVKNTSNYLLADVRYGLRAQLGFKGFDFFFEYDFNEMFQENQGAPELRRMQFGITF